MREQIEEMLQLQPAWTSQNTSKMARRGVVVRIKMAAWLRGILPELSALVPPRVDDPAVQGRDGTGLKTRATWSRVYSTSRSPSAARSIVDALPELDVRELQSQRAFVLLSR